MTDTDRTAEARARLAAFEDARRESEKFQEHNPGAIEGPLLVIARFELQDKAAEDIAHLLARVGELEDQLAKARVDVDGWTVHNRPGGVMVSHDTDADRPALLGDMHVPLGAVLAFIADAATEEVIGPDTLCPCGKVNDGTGSGYCSAEHFDEYDGWSL